MSKRTLEDIYGPNYGIGKTLSAVEENFRRRMAGPDCRHPVPSWDEILDGGGKLIPCSRVLKP